MRALFRKAMLGVAVTAITISGVWAQAQRNWKDRAEYDLYVAITQALQGNDGAKALQLLKEWTEKYPESDYADARPAFELNAYKAANDPKGMMGAAEKILRDKPQDLTANYWVCTLTLANNMTTPEDLTRAGKAGETLANLEKPAELPDAQWPQIQTEMAALGHKCSGFVAMTQKNNEKAEAEFEASLKLKTDDAQVSSMLGNVILAQKVVEKQSKALFHYARAASYTGPGALPDQARQQLDSFFVNAYNRYHGEDPEGLEQLRTLAKNNALPPPDFKIMTAAEVAIAEDQRMKTEQPQLYFWLQVKAALQGPTGAEYFENGMKDALVPTKEQLPLKGTVLEATKKSMKLALSDNSTHEVTLTMDPALKSAPAPGTVVEFWGVAQKLSKDPFLVEFLIAGDQAKLQILETANE